MDGRDWQAGSIIGAEQYRAMTFIRTANLGGYLPTVNQVQAWLDQPGRIPGKVTRKRVESPFGGAAKPSFTVSSLINDAMEKSYRPIGEMMQQLVGTAPPAYMAPWRQAMEQARYIETRAPDETVLAQLLRLMWLEEVDGGLRLTQLGHALYRADRERDGGDEVQFLGGSEDPLAWASLVGFLTDLGDCTIIDPYLKAPQYLPLAQLTEVSRIVIGPKVSKGELAALQVAHAGLDSNVEIRRHTGGMHDRFIIARDSVHTLGCSLNGVGKNPTTLIRLHGEIADSARRIADDMWEAATPLASIFHEVVDLLLIGFGLVVSGRFPACGRR
ncbi:hypothetical protein [Tsukamurella pseudospumae]|uniref:Uncharacterized protein n=1 Tax=Tsukamurella pseudospumae TaxID=239498 RepID=A0A138ANJ8_9ACTN|nr:hypothetical protein [Tsukamurella pseudospumae]KXP12010.1 hypothetical protein AXK60_24220 [Tsukamurella pseudospumae]